MKKGVNWIENWDENWYKMDKIEAKSLKLDRHKLIFSAERGGQSDLVAPYNWDQIGSTIAKTGSSLQNLPTMPKYDSTSLPHEMSLYF